MPATLLIFPEDLGEEEEGEEGAGKEPKDGGTGNTLPAVAGVKSPLITSGGEADKLDAGEDEEPARQWVFAAQVVEKGHESVRKNDEGERGVEEPEENG